MQIVKLKIVSSIILYYIILIILIVNLVGVELPEESLEKFMKNVDEIEQILNDLGFNTVEQLKDNIVNDELKSN